MKLSAPPSPQRIGWIATVTLLLCLGLEKLFTGVLPQGSVFTLFEVTLGIAAAGVAALSGSPMKNRLALSVLLIALADGTFFLWNYLLKVDITQETGSLVGVLLYGTSFLMGAGVLLGFMRRADSIDIKRFLIPAVTVLCIVLIYFLPQLIEARAQDSSPLLAISQGYTLGTATLCAIVGLTTLTYSLSPFLVHYGISFTMLPILIITMAAEIFKKGPLPFGLYEYLWGFGSFWVYTAVILQLAGGRRFESMKLEWLNRSSISVYYKTTLITGVALILLGLTLVAPETPIQWVSFGIIASIFLSVLISSHLANSISRHSLTLGKVLEHGFSSGKSALSTQLKDLPVELEDIFSSVFAENLEKKRVEQENQARYLELQRRFAHDIRTPIKALENILREENLGEGEFRQTATEAIRSMISTSERILVDLRESLSKPQATISSSTALDLEKVARKCLRILESSLENSRKIQLTLSPVRQPLHSWIDETSLDRVLFNLLKNASESHGCSRIAVTLEEVGVPEGNEDPNVRIEISDDGEGASPDLLEKLNQGIAITTKPGGHGIGIASTQELVRHQGGRLRFENRKDQTFKAILELPRASTHLMLIDDDRAIHLAWKALARKRNIKLTALFPSGDLLEEVGRQATALTEIHVDYNLREEFGNTILKALKAGGYTRIHLVTSSDIHALPRVVLDEAREQGWTIRDKTFPRG